jgi:hypothetical protein
MLRIDFGNLPVEHPDLAKAFDAISQWTKENPRATFLDLRRLIAKYADISAYSLALALNILVAKRIIKQSYRVIAPTNHVLADGFFDSIDDIPDQMFDTAENRFKTENANVVPVFSEARE